jgi:hydroxymethylbilane synthase
MQKLRLGTRGSSLALWQANCVAEQITRLKTDLEIEIKTIKTQGDKITDVALSKIGDKGLFTKEIENELIAGHIDLAVHSMKDLPSLLAPGLVLAGVLSRENPQDVLISVQGYTLATLPEYGRVGTSSLRRVAQLKAIRPDLVMVDIRGNIETRLRKIPEYQLDGIILAFAGVKRLGFTEQITEIIPTGAILPAVGQGAIAIETRASDQTTLDIIALVDDAKTRRETTAERALLRVLEGGCQVPIASLGNINGNVLALEGLVASLDGSLVIKDSCSGDPNEAEAIGRQLAQKLLDRGAQTVLAEIRKLGES